MKREASIQSKSTQNCSKVENSLKGSLDLIPLPSSSVESQIMGVKVCLWCKSKTLLGIVNKLWKQKVCWHHPAIFRLITSSKLSRHDMNFKWRWRWWDQIQTTFLNLFYYCNISDSIFIGMHCPFIGPHFILDWPKFIGLNRTYLTWLKKQKSFLKNQCWSVSKSSGLRRTKPVVFC